MSSKTKFAPMVIERRWRALLVTLDRLPPFFSNEDDAIRTFARHYKIPLRRVLAELKTRRHSANRTLH